VADGSCLGEVVESVSVEGFGTAAAGVVVPLTPGTYELCLESEIVTSFTVMDCGAACRISTVQNVLSLWRGRDSSLPFEIESAGAGGSFLLSLNRFEDDGRTIPMDVPPFLSVPQSVDVIDGVVTPFTVTAQDPQPVGDQFFWGNVIVRAEGPVSCELAFDVDISADEPPGMSLDIKPGSCPNPVNVKSKGVLPVAVLGTEEFDVSTIDPSTITLSREGAEESVSPLRWSYEDVATPFEGELCDCHDLNGDGYLDLTLKFKIQEMVATLGLDEICGGTIPLTLLANLEDGTAIAARDCVWLLKEICDNGIDDDEDGLIDAADADCTLGACTGTAEASVYEANQVYGASALGRHLACILLPLAVAIVLRSWRRKKS
jgi:hypothetical protein